MTLALLQVTNPALIGRENPIHWDALLEWFGRGRSPIARAAHLLSFPLMALAGLLLIVDLSRPERFMHMIVQVKTWLPMIKPWSPMSLGSWLVLLFPIFAFVSFVDALVDRGTFRFGGWRPGRTIHGSGFGRVWATIGGILALAVGIYSGVLLSATQFPGWADSSLVGALFVATALATGMAALLLIVSMNRRAEAADVHDLARAATFMVVWQMLLLVVYVMSLGPSGARYMLAGLSLVALILAAIVGGIVPIVLLRFGAGRLRPATVALGALMMLIGGLLIRIAVVAGPQVHG